MGPPSQTAAGARATFVLFFPSCIRKRIQYGALQGRATNNDFQAAMLCFIVPMLCCSISVLCRHVDLT